MDRKSQAERKNPSLLISGSTAFSSTSSGKRVRERQRRGGQN